MTVVILVLILIGQAVLLSIAIKKAVELRKELKQEKQNAKIDKETYEKIEQISNTEDVAAGVHAGSNILHQLAQERR